MKKISSKILLLSLAAAAYGISRARARRLASQNAEWQAKLDRMLSVLGHRNWILIVDSAYPLQTSPGIETIETRQGLPEVASYVLNAVGRSIHVKPELFMDAELPFVAEADAPGVSQYCSEIRTVLGDRPVTLLPHEQLLQKISEAGTSFKTLVLKTNETFPYTSVFLRFDCGYWSQDAETRMRDAMAAGALP